MEDEIKDLPKQEEEEVEEEEVKEEEEKLDELKEEDELEDPKEEDELEESKEDVDVPSGTTEPEVKTYQGKKIISEKTSEINGVEYISITLEDGSVSQLSQEEYNEGVK